MKKKALPLKEAKGQPTLIHHMDLAHSSRSELIYKGFSTSVQDSLLHDEMEQNKENSVYFSATVT